MFTFLNSLLLFALPAALLPLLIHLFTRRKIKTVLFSSLTFLKQLQRQRMRLLKLYQWLLLLIRTLIVLLVILAFARPALKGVFTTGIGAHAASTVVILLDNSFSMGLDTREGILFDLARKKAQEILQLLKPEDEAHLIIFNDRVSFINEEPTHNIKWLEDIIAKAELTARGTSIQPVIRSAIGILEKSQNINKEIYLLSDLTRQGWQPLAADTTGPPQVWPYALYCFQLSEAGRAENVAVTETGLDNQIISVSQPLSIRAQIANFSDHEADNVLVRLNVGARRVNETSINLGPWEAKVVLLPLLVEAPGWHHGSVAVADDALALDNRGYFTFLVPEHIPVLVVGTGQDNRRSPDVDYIRYALNPSQKPAALIRPTCIQQRHLTQYALEKYRVVVFTNVTGFSEPEKHLLERFCEDGGSLMFFLGDNADVRAHNSLLKALGSATVMAVRGQPGDQQSFSSFAHYALEHPVFKTLLKPNQPIDAPRVYAYYQLQVPVRDQKLIRFGNNDTALLETACKGGKVFIFPFSLDPTWSNFALKGSFVPILYRLVQYAATDLAREPHGISVGKRYEQRITLTGPVDQITGRNPRGEVYSLPVSQEQGRPHISFENTDLPGLYSLYARQQLVREFAVNCDPAESDIKPLEGNELKKAMPFTTWRQLKPDSELASAILETRYGREVFTEVLWLVAGLFVCEMIVARKRKYIKEKS